MAIIKWIYKVFLVLAAHTCVSDGANILAFFTIPSYSHQMPLLRLTRALAARGHNLTVITANPSKEPIANHTDVDLSFCYELFRQGHLGFTLHTKIHAFQIIKDTLMAMIILAEVQLKSPQMQNFLSWAKDVKYDLVLYEPMWMTPYLAFAHTLGSPPVVGITTIESNVFLTSAMGSPLNLADAPSFLPCTDHMTFYERLYNVALYFWFIFHRDWYTFPSQDKLTRELFGEGIPSSYELERNKTLLMLSSDNSLFYPQASTPNVVNLGPLHIMKPKALPQELEKWVSGAKDGVIYFSLGSNMQGTALPNETREAFLTVFSYFPNYRIIWKWESDSFFPGQPENILFKKWIPQQDLLAHPKVKLFITQGGLQSLQESIHHAVPLVCIPLFGDQGVNVRKVVQAEVGAELDFYNLTNETIVAAVNAVLHDTKYRENMRRMSNIPKNRVLSPVDQGIWWAEYVLKYNGAPHVRPATLDLHWTQYLLIDVAVFVISVVCVLIFVLFKLLQLVYNMYLSYVIQFKLKQI